MKSVKKRSIAFLLAMVVVFSMALPVLADTDSKESTRASAYISYVYARTTVSGSSVNVYFAITGTGTMSSLGATGITIYNSSNTCVAILDSSNTTGLMGYNRGYYSNTISWNGAESGERYYAIVGYKAEDSTGYDTTSYLTDWS